MNVASGKKKEKSKMKRNQSFLVSMTEQNMVPFTKTENMAIGGVHFDILNFTCL